MDQNFNKDIKKNKYELQKEFCINCEKEFSFLPSKHHSTQRFCSLSCSISNRNKTIKITFSKERNKKIGLFQKKRVRNYKIKKCKFCNKEYTKSRSLFCSKDCAKLNRQALYDSKLIKVSKKSNETKIKMRLSAIKHIEKYRGKLKTNIGKNETQLLNEQEIKDNCKIERQYFIKELGYTVDGYDLINNTVYEVYEKFHYKNTQRIEFDINRQKLIEQFLKCKFIILEDFND